MATKYLYLDDEVAEIVRPLIARVSRLADLEIELAFPAPYEDQIDLVDSKDHDALLLDLRLDQHVDPTARTQVRAKYRATTLAQEIRTRATESKIREFPIVLWSMDSRLKQSFNHDDTGHDLFDLACVKEELTDECKARDIAMKMVSLVNGYATIEEIRQSGPKNRRPAMHELLCLPKEDSDLLDPRIALTFEGEAGKIPTHEYARFILRHLLEAPGPLIDISVLAARLGLDIDASEDLTELVESKLSSVRYQGPFREGWQRWWAHRLQNWWIGLPGANGSLRQTRASDRVAVIRAATGLMRLHDATPINDAYSTRYWTACVGSKRPLDPENGFVMAARAYRPWQDRSYVSLEGFSEALSADPSIRIDPFDSQRFKRARTLKPHDDQ